MDLLRNIDVGHLLMQYAVLLFSLSIHEAAHAWMADRLGDYTARSLGRVTLNPIPHMNLIGTVLFPLLQFILQFPLIGWAKPVPVNPSHLRRPGRDQILISLAGPGSNLLAAGVAFLLLLFFKLLSADASGFILNMSITFNVPHQGSIWAPLVGLVFFSLIINLALALFNLLPIPPLDGHWMLYGLLPYNAALALEKVSSYGFLLLYGLMFLGMLHFLFVPVRWVLSLLLLI